MRNISAILLIGVLFVSGCVQAELTIKTLAENGEQYVGKEVNVSGIADVGKTICTLIMCEPENPCCNACGGDLVLKDGGSSIEIRGEYGGKPAGCGGDNCNITCHPLEKGKMYRVSGILEKEDGEYHINLKTFREGG